MKFLLSLLFIVAAPAFSQDCTNCSQEGDKIGDCQILEPNTNDSNGRYCSGTSFGVTYQGYMASDECYSSIREAMTAMRSIRSCNKAPKIGNCKILNPNTNDTNSRYCSRTYFGITYKGYMASNECFKSIDKAMAQMESMSECLEEDKLTSYAILYPNTNDKNGRYCSGTYFGVTYKGYMASDECYSSISKAMTAMKELN